MSLRQYHHRVYPFKQRLDCRTFQTGLSTRIMANHQMHATTTMDNEFYLVEVVALDLFLLMSTRNFSSWAMVVYLILTWIILTSPRGETGVSTRLLTSITVSMRDLGVSTQRPFARRASKDM